MHAISTTLTTKGPKLRNWLARLGYMNDDNIRGVGYG